MTFAITNNEFKLQEKAKRITEVVLKNSKPSSSGFHIISSGPRNVIFVPNGSQVKILDYETLSHLERLTEFGDEEFIRSQLLALGLDNDFKIDNTSLQSPPVHAISLTIAQKCNMGCAYCYADHGNFGERSKSMNLETALQAVDFLFKDKIRGDNVNIAFMGGEPLLNRVDLRTVTSYATNVGIKSGINTNFSITTNGTLLNEDDGLFFEEYGFAVTVSLDGKQKEHDALRHLASGKGTYHSIVENVQRFLLPLQKKMQVSARMTISTENKDIIDVVDHFIKMGFHSIGLSPLIKSINGEKEMSKEDLNELLEGMIACGLKFEEALLSGRRYPFLNMINAYREISKGTHRPYPCGAGAGYLGVSAEGDLFACHRFVNDKDGFMGNISDGVDVVKQSVWLSERHVHKQEPCNRCWARYLCGGGCHHEVIAKGRMACNFIRGWLHFVIQSYERMNRLVPNWQQRMSHVNI